MVCCNHSREFVSSLSLKSHYLYSFWTYYLQNIVFFSTYCAYCACVRARMLSCFSRVQLFVIPWTVAHRAPLFMEFARQEYWSGYPFLSPRNLPNPGIKVGSPALQAGFFYWMSRVCVCVCVCVCVYLHRHIYIPAFLVAQRVKCLPTMRETWIRSLGWEDNLEKEKATHSRTLAWKIHGRRSLVAYSP